MAEQNSLFSNEWLWGASPGMQRLRAQIDKVAASNVTVLIEGDSGTGKEMLARMIHQLSARASQPFVAVNCGAVPDTLFESEFFGFEKNAFTGADAAKPGKFELAHGGTLFLDEIASMSIHHQVKLLRVLQEKHIDRVGGSSPVPVDVRVIAAASDLKPAVQQGRFRLDLYHRIHVVALDVPSLSQRREDIPILLQFFLDKNNAKYNKHVRINTEVILPVLLSYIWPGNVRELSHLVERWVCLADADQCLGGEVIPYDMHRDAAPDPLSSAPVLSQIKNLNHALAEYERAIIRDAMRQAGNNKAAAARILGIDRRSLHNKLKRLNLS